MSTPGTSVVKVAIVADDLTGAADCAAAFAAAGHRPLVLLESGAGVLADGHGCDVVALSVDSRDVDPTAAGEAVAAAVSEIASGVPGTWFKKIDSTLRGHVALELRIVSDLLSPELTIVCPAFPATGRALRDGHAHVHGEPLERTELWRRSGGGLPHLPTMLSGEGVETTAVALPELRAGGLATRIRAAARGAVLVVDAETEADLDAIARAGADCERKLLWVGSAGLAAALASALPAAAGELDPWESQRPADGSTGGPVLIVAGSAAPQTRRQLTELERVCGATTALLTTAELLADDAAAWRATADAVAGSLASGRDVALAIEPLPSDSLLPGYGSRLVERLGELVRGLSGRFDGLVLTGGATARAVLHAMGVRGLAVLGSVELGIPVARAVPSGLRVVTKAGAFGDDQSLSRAVRVLRTWPADSYRGAYGGDRMMKS